MNDSFDIEALEREQEEAHRRFQERLKALGGGEGKGAEKSRPTAIRVSRRGSITIFPRKEKELDIDIEAPSLLNTPTWWEDLCQIATFRQIKKNEALGVLRKMKNVSAERLVAFQEVSVPTLPDPGTLYLFDQFEIPTWRDDGYAYDKKNEEKISDKTLIVEKSFLRDDDRFCRTSFSLPGSRLWIVQYFDAFDSEDEEEERILIEDEEGDKEVKNISIHDDDDDVVDALVEAYDKSLGEEEEEEDTTTADTHDTAAQKYVDKLNQMLQLEEELNEKEEELPPPPPTLPPSMIRDLTYAEFKKQTLARANSRKQRVKEISARENQVRNVIYRWKTARREKKTKKKKKKIPSSGLPFLHHGVSSRKTDEKRRNNYPLEDLKRDRAKAMRLYERQKIRESVRTRREVERLRSIVSQSIAHNNAAAAAVVEVRNSESLFRATGVSVLIRAARDLRLAEAADIDEDFFEPTCCVWLERDAKRCSKRRVTPTRRGSNPEWNRNFHFKIPSEDIENCVLVMEVRNSDRFASKQALGRLRLDLSALTDERGMSSRLNVVDSWLDIVSTEREYCGEINIRVEATLLSSPMSSPRRNDIVVVEETPPPHSPQQSSPKTTTTSEKKKFEFLKRKSKRVEPIHLDWSNVKSKTITHLSPITSSSTQQQQNYFNDDLERTRQDLADAWLDTYRSAEVRSEWEGLTNDGDRQFDLEEFEYLVKCLLPTVRLDRVGHIFNELKLNDSGTIRWFDFLNFLKTRRRDDDDSVPPLSVDELEPLDNRIEAQVTALKQQREKDRLRLMRELDPEDR